TIWKARYRAHTSSIDTLPHLPGLRKGGHPVRSPTKPSNQMKHMRILSFEELKSLTHIAWNKEHIAELVAAGLFPPPIHQGVWRESHIDDWMKAHMAKGDLSWMQFSLRTR